MWERVFTITDFYDRPRKGVANFKGRPHAYESEFSNVEDDYTDRYFLKPIDEELLALVMETWAIWLSWCESFHRKEVDLKSHPALPDDRERYDALTDAIGSRLAVDNSRAIIKAAKFRSANICGDGAEVEWTDFEVPEAKAR